MGKKMSFILVALLLVSCSEQEKKYRVLPILGNYDVEYKMINGVEVADTIFPEIPFFVFRNQDSALVKSTDLKNKIWVADFFFTSCSSICPGMTSQMKKMAERTKDLKDHVQFISFSIDPEVDRPSVLKTYIKNYSIKSENWIFLTGKEEETHRLGEESFLIDALEDDSAPDGFAHSEAFTLVDKEKHVRGVYNIGQESEMDRLEKDLRKLLKEEYEIVGSK